MPAECPGEQSKEERKKLKQERQGTANALLKPGSSPSVSELPDLSRSNTMNSLSSGYAASAQRSLSGRCRLRKRVLPNRPAGPRVLSRLGNTIKKNRVVAPPPTAYISELPGSTPNGSAGAGEQKGRMIYAFEAGADGELSVTEGREIVILEADSRFTLSHYAI